MKVENLKEGMIIKSYRQLCEILNIKQTSGNSKIAQLKELERFIKYRRSGNSFIVDEIYQAPLSKFDGRGGESLYSEDIQFLIMNILAEEKEGTIEISCSKLLGVLNLVNSNYLEGEKNIKALSEISLVPIKNCMDFYNFSRNNLRTKIETALNALEKQRLIMWEKVFYVDLIEFDEDSGEIVHTHRAANKHEKKEILRIERSVVELMGFEGIPYISPNKMKEFRREVNKRLEEIGLNINYYYKSYVITFNEAPIKKKIDSVLSRLNENIAKCLINEANTKHNLAIKKADLIINNGGNDESNPIKFSKLHYEDDYVAYASNLTDLLIKLDANGVNFTSK